MSARTFIVLAIFAAIAYVPLQAGAQFTIPGAETALIISLTPSNPAPHSNVVLTLQSPLYDLAKSDITWTVNGKRAAQGAGLKTLSLTTGALGSALSVSVGVRADNGIASTNTTISPTSVDILWEADSYTPPFYKGRALPSAGSSVTLVAIPHFTRSNGSSIASDKIIYTWKKDDEVIASASGLGKASARIAGPLLYGNDLITVEAVAQDGTLSGDASVRIADIEPALMLYEAHPLFGALYHQALGPASFIPEIEMTFAAVPLFAAVQSPDDSRLAYEWQVNETRVTADTAHPSMLTINASKSSGIALIRLALTHATNYFMNLNDAWKVTFTKDGAAAGGGDLFHQ